MAEAKDCETKVEEIAAEVASLRTTSATQAVTAALGVAEWARLSKDDQVRAKARDVVLGALELLKESQAAPLVEELSEEQADTLLKYTFKGMEAWSQNKDDAKRCTMLLKIHEAVVAKHGQGAIMRVMVDRKL